MKRPHYNPIIDRIYATDLSEDDKEFLVDLVMANSIPLEQRAATVEKLKAVGEKFGFLAPQTATAQPIK